jgi:hypothetical protein
MQQKMAQAMQDPAAAEEMRQVQEITPSVCSFQVC